MKWRENEISFTDVWMSYPETGYQTIVTKTSEIIGSVETYSPRNFFQSCEVNYYTLPFMKNELGEYFSADTCLLSEYTTETCKEFYHYKTQDFDRFLEVINYLRLNGYSHVWE